jgi:hypothetical protein
MVYATLRDPSSQLQSRIPSKCFPFISIGDFGSAPPMEISSKPSPAARRGEMATRACAPPVPGPRRGCRSAHCPRCCGRVSVGRPQARAPSAADPSARHVPETRLVAQRQSGGIPFLTCPTNCDVPSSADRLYGINQPHIVSLNREIVTSRSVTSMFVWRY